MEKVKKNTGSAQLWIHESDRSATHKKINVKHTRNQIKIKFKAVKMINGNVYVFINRYEGPVYPMLKCIKMKLSLDIKKWFMNPLYGIGINANQWENVWIWIWILTAERGHSKSR